MLRLAKSFWDDQAGFVVSAELVLISSVGVIGLVTGLTCLRNAVNDELKDVSCAIKALDQSYCYTGFHSYKDPCHCRTKARTAGSTNVYTSYEPEVVPVEEITPVREETAEQRQGEIISEQVISERIISERVLDEQDLEPLAPDIDCPPEKSEKPVGPEHSSKEPGPSPTPVDSAAPTEKPAK